jgi:putative DNA primase/helicase
MELLKVLAEIQRLAGLKNDVEYELELEKAAKALGMRPGKLDKLVKKARRKSADGADGEKKPPEWKPAEAVHTEKVVGAKLLSELVAAIRRFVDLSTSDALVAALWVLFTWVFEHCAEINAFLHVQSPTPQCGKTTLFKVLKRIARRGWIVARITPSAFTRKMNSERCTLFLDEGDAFLTENESMRNLLDGASDPETANVALSVKAGDEWLPTEFNLYVPIAIASIGPLYGMRTVEDRSITIRLKRATPAALKQLDRGRQRELKAVLDPLAAKCARWATDNLEALKNARPKLPDSVSGREQDKWDLLIAIADRCGGEIPRWARAAMVRLSAAGRKKSASTSEQLLADIRQIFEDRGDDRITSADLCEALTALELRPWKEYGRRRKPITQIQVARLLDFFDIEPGSIRLPEGRTPKGYLRKDFEDAFSAYLTSIYLDPNRHNATTTGGVCENDDFQSATDHPCGVSENGTSPYGENECGGVADQKREYEGVEVKSGGTQAHTNDTDEATNDPGRNGMPFKIIEWMKTCLHHLGHTDGEIGRMTPSQAHEILRAGLQDRGYTEAQIREFTPAQKQAAIFGADPNEEEIF